MPDPATDGAPLQLGRYSIGRKLGAGGVGVVYRATDPSLDREVAIKLLKTAGSGTQAQVRLVREARALAQLSHPNVVQLFDVGTYDESAGFGGDGVFIVMELIDGVTLREFIAGHQPKWRRVVSLLLAAGRGLEIAHAANLIHRDFKPGNVLVDRDGRVRVLDFGLARAAGEHLPTRPAGPPDQADSVDLEENLTATGVLVGTPAYMPPEQLDGETIDGSADQFAFCVTLWEMLFGTRPFVARTVPNLSMLIRRGPPVAPDGSRVPPAVVAVLQRGLAHEPAERYPSISELLVDLEHAARRRRWTLPTLAGGLAAAIITTAAVLPGRQGVDPSEPGAPEQLDPVLVRDRSSFEARLAAAALGNGLGLEVAARAHLVALLEEARESTDPARIAAAATALSRKRLVQREYEDAERLASEALDLATQSARDDTAFDALMVLGGATWGRARIDAAKRHARQAESLLALLDNDVRRNGTAPRAAGPARGLGGGRGHRVHARARSH